MRLVDDKRREIYLPSVDQRSIVGPDGGMHTHRLSGFAICIWTGVQYSTINLVGAVIRWLCSGRVVSFGHLNHRLQ